MACDGRQAVHGARRVTPGLPLPWPAKCYRRSQQLRVDQGQETYRDDTLWEEMPGDAKRTFRRQPRFPPASPDLQPHPGPKPALVHHHPALILALWMLDVGYEKMPILCGDDGRQNQSCQTRPVLEEVKQSDLAERTWLQKTRRETRLVYDMKVRERVREREMKEKRKKIAMEAT